MPRSPAADSRARVLGAARALLAQRGFNAFSFRDLAAAVDIKSSSVHHHFATKEDLGVALVRAYAVEMRAFFERLEAEGPHDPAARLQAFVALFVATAGEGDRLCLAGMLASDFATLGDALRAEVTAFFAMVEHWLAVQIAALGGARPSQAARRHARFLMSALEGALMSARVFGEPVRVRQAGALALELVLSFQR